MKSRAGFVLCLIGGILNIILGVLTGLVFLAMFIIKDLVVEFEELNLLAGSLEVFLAIAFVWLIVLGIVSIIFSLKINNNESAKTGSIACMISGFLSVNIFLIIGGIVGLIISFKEENKLVSLN